MFRSSHTLADELLKTNLFWGMEGRLGKGKEQGGRSGNGWLVVVDERALIPELWLGLKELTLLVISTTFWTFTLHVDEISSTLRINDTSSVFLRIEKKKVYANKNKVTTCPTTSSTMLELHHVVALGIFSTYFIVILALFSLILTNLWSLRAPLKLTKNWFTIQRVTTFIGLTVASLTHTWFCESFQVLHSGCLTRKNCNRYDQIYDSKLIFNYLMFIRE